MTNEHLNILYAVSEAFPIAKTGGLADVAGNLPKVIQKREHQVQVVLPFYQEVRKMILPAQGPEFAADIALGEKLERAEFFRVRLEDEGVPHWLVRHDGFFDRQGLYGASGGDYPDNGARFIFFCKAVAALARRETPDLIHCNDWQTGLVPALLATTMSGDPVMGRIGTLFTIHNVAYQGLFPREDMAMTGMDLRHFNWREMEFWGHLNCLKAGAVYADILNTVSPTYAREIQSEDLGYGLDGVFRDRALDLFGVTNGIGPEWDPATDPLIPAVYSWDDLSGKAVCKRTLQARLGLPQTDAPLFGMVTRFVENKGLNLVLDVMEKLFAKGAQLVLLGSGEPHYETAFQTAMARFQDQLHVQNKYDNALAHSIEAGADIFLMPSRFEPCGLNQLYSLKYGTVPIVRKTGGLADTVAHCTRDALLGGDGTGFVFTQYAAWALWQSIQEALALYRQKDLWNTLMVNGMLQDFSWSRSAMEYEHLYHKVVAKKAMRSA